MKIKDTRFSHKLESLFWWILRLLPLIIFVVYCIGASRSEGLWSFVVDDGGDMMATRYICLSNIISETFAFYPSDFFINLFIDVFGSDGVFSIVTQNYCGLFDYFIYCVSLELLRVIYHVLIFIPRLVNRLLEKYGG